MKSVSLITGLLLVCLCAARAQAEQRIREQFMPAGPYCGVYSLYAGLRAEGVHVHLRDLLRVEYISRPDGSTLEDLQRAALDQNVQATLLTDLDLDTLRQMGCP